MDDKVAVAAEHHANKKLSLALRVIQSIEDAGLTIEGSLEDVKMAVSQPHPQR